MGTGPEGAPLSPLGRRTRVITGTNAPAVLPAESSSSRSTTVACVAAGTRKSAASASSMSTRSRSVAARMRFCAALSAPSALGSRSIAAAAGSTSSRRRMETMRAESPSSASVTRSEVTPSPVPSSITSPVSRSAELCSPARRRRSPRWTTVVPLVERRSWSTTRTPSTTTRACSAETCMSWSTTSLCGARPMLTSSPGKLEGRARREALRHLEEQHRTFFIAPAAPSAP